MTLSRQESFGGWWSPTGFIPDDLKRWAATKKALTHQRVVVTIVPEPPPKPKEEP